MPADDNQRETALVSWLIPVDREQGKGPGDVQHSGAPIMEVGGSYPLATMMHEEWQQSERYSAESVTKMGDDSVAGPKNPQGRRSATWTR